MTNSEFKWMYNAVIKANTNSDVWYMGYLWMDLTTLQKKKLCAVLETKGCVNQVCKTIGNRIEKWYEFPNGLQFRKV